MEPFKPHPGIFFCHFPRKGHDQLTIEDMPNTKEIILFRVVFGCREQVFYGYQWADSRVEHLSEDKWCQKAIKNIQELAEEVLNLVLWHPGIFPEGVENLKPRLVSDPNHFSFQQGGHCGGIGIPDRACFGLTKRGLEEFWKTFLDLAK